MMVSESKDHIASFRLERWHPLTEPPVPAQGTRQNLPTAPQTNQSVTPAPAHAHTHAPFVGASPVLTKLLYDVLVYPYNSVRARIQRLNISTRAFENAKREGLEKGFILESAAGATTYVIPLVRTFATFEFPCPYKRNVSPEHSYFVGLGQHLLRQDPANKTVHTELKVGDSNCTADLVAVAHDGARRAYEVTLSTTNILSNAAKYDRTDFAQIVFLCRDYKLREAVRACCREGGLDAGLLARLEFMQFSTLISHQRKVSRH
jgi:hypothetical protein